MFGKIETRLNFYSWAALMCAAFFLGCNLLSNTFGVVVLPLLVFMMIFRAACFRVREPSLLRRLVGRHGLVFAPTNIVFVGFAAFLGALIGPFSVPVNQLMIATVVFSVLFCEHAIAFLTNRGKNGLWIYPLLPDDDKKEKPSDPDGVGMFFMLHVIFFIFIAVSFVFYHDNDVANMLRQAIILGLLTFVIFFFMYLCIAREDYILKDFRPSNYSKALGDIDGLLSK